MNMESMAKQSYQQKKEFQNTACFATLLLIRGSLLLVRSGAQERSCILLGWFPWAAFHWDRYLQDFVGCLRHCTVLPNSWYIETLNSSRATTRSTLRLQSLGSLVLPHVFSCFVCQMPWFNAVEANHSRDVSTDEVTLVSTTAIAWCGCGFYIRYSLRWTRMGCSCKGVPLFRQRMIWAKEPRVFD